MSGTSDTRTRRRTLASGGLLLWLGTVAFGASTVALLAILGRRPTHGSFASLAALLSLSFVVSLIPAGLQLRSASLVADGGGIPRLTRRQIVGIAAVSLAISPLLAVLLHVPVLAAAIVDVQMVVAIPLATRQGALLAHHHFAALGLNLVFESLVRVGAGVLLGLHWGVTGLAVGICAGTAAALGLLPRRAVRTEATERPRTSLLDTSLALAILGLYVQFDVLVAPTALHHAAANRYDLAAVPAKGVYLALLAAGPLLFPFVRRRQDSRRLVAVAAAVNLFLGLVLVGVLAASRNLIGLILGQPAPDLLLLVLLGLAMTLAGVTAAVVSASVARGVARPWPPLVVGIAVLLVACTADLSALGFALVVLGSQAATTAGSLVVCFLGRRKPTGATAATAPVGPG